MSPKSLIYRRRLTLMTLLIAATVPMRPAPIDARSTQRAASSSWNSSPAAETFYRDFLNGNGSPLPKIRVKEMAPELASALALPTTTSAFNFLPLNRRDWSLRQAGYNRHVKEQLQLHQTWLGELQSPVKEQHTFSQPKELRRLLKRMSSMGNDYQGPLYRPSISAGVMTNLGEFFNQLKANVHFAEQSQQLGEAETQLLEGLHPHQLEQPVREDEDAAETEEQGLEQSSSSDAIENAVDGYPSSASRKSSKLLQSARSYRPSQKIRSLVSRNPNGYRGSQFIDPSYMWLGLGK